MAKMKIGELGLAAGCQAETIRYYEREGLLPAPLRSSGNYRLYDDRHLERLGFIRRCRTLDMSLAEVRRLLDFRDVPQKTCGEVNGLLDAQIEKIRQRMAELDALHAQMTALRARCSQELAGSACGILKGLAQA